MSRMNGSFSGLVSRLPYAPIGNTYGDEYSPNALNPHAFSRFAAWPTYGHHGM